MQAIYKRIISMKLCHSFMVDVIANVMRNTDEDQEEEECQERDSVHDDGLRAVWDW